MGGLSLRDHVGGKHNNAVDLTQFLVAAQLEETQLSGGGSRIGIWEMALGGPFTTLQTDSISENWARRAGVGVCKYSVQSSPVPRFSLPLLDLKHKLSFHSFRASLTLPVCGNACYGQLAR